MVQADKKIESCENSLNLSPSYYQGYQKSPPSAELGKNKTSYKSIESPKQCGNKPLTKGQKIQINLEHIIQGRKLGPNSKAEVEACEYIPRKTSKNNKPLCSGCDQVNTKY